MENGGEKNTTSILSRSNRWYHSCMNTTSTPRLTGCLVIFIAACLLGLVFLLGLPAAGAYLVVADDLEPADAVVQLSGDTGRISETVALYKDGLAGTLIFTETGQRSTDPEAPDTNSTMANRQQALSLGIPEDSIIVTQGKSSSTVDEAIAVRALMERKNLKSCIVVTDPFHSRRTRLVFANVFRDSGINVMVQPVREHWYSSRTWFLSTRGWKTTLQEFAKLIAYRSGVQGD